jgi:hypothetical protein
MRHARFWRLLAAGLTATAAHAAVAGAPEPGAAGVLPVATLKTSNDMFANGLGNGDDFRTAAVGGLLRLDHVVVTFDAAMLTDRAAGTRSDELLAVAGYAFGPDEPRSGWQIGGFLGAGIRVDGDISGQEVQNAVHRTINVDEVHLAYDARDRIRPTTTGSVVGGWLGPAGLGLTGWWGVQLVAAGQWTPEGELLAEVGPRLSLVGREGAFWVGVRQRLRDGQPPGGTVAATEAHEDGLWLDSGTWITPLRCGERVWGWQVQAAINPETRAATGSVGLVVSPGAGPAGREVALAHDLAVYSGGGLGVQLRWYPFPYQDAQRSALVLDYSFGTQPDGRLLLGTSDDAFGADLRHDQWTVGWEEGYRSPDWSGVRFVPWVQAAAGLRQEGVVAETRPGLFLDGRATTPVARGAAGVRVEWRDLLSLGGSLDGWLPAWREELRAGGQSITLNDPGWAVGVHLAAHVAW